MPNNNSQIQQLINVTQQLTQVTQSLAQQLQGQPQATPAPSQQQPQATPTPVQATPAPTPAQPQATPAPVQPQPAPAQPQGTPAPAQQRQQQNQQQGSRINNLRVGGRFYDIVKNKGKMVLNLAWHVFAGITIFNLLTHASSLAIALASGYFLFHTFCHAVREWDRDKVLTRTP